MEKSFAIGSSTAAQTRFKVLGAISFSHYLNDMMQSLIVAIYPLLKGEFALSFVQIGMCFSLIGIAGAPGAVDSLTVHIP